VPVFNTAPEHLAECLESILAQTVQPYQMLIIDDGSTRVETRTYLNSLQLSPVATGAFRLIRNERNIGLGPTMNRALRLCSTDFALKVDSDDVARPTLVERFLISLDINPEIDVCGCQCQNFGLTDFVTAHPLHVTWNDAMHRPWFVNHTGVLLNVKSVLAAGGYRRMRGMAEDYELWLRMMRRGYRRFYNLPDVLVDYRDRLDGLHRRLSPLNGTMRRMCRGLLRLCG